MIYEILDWILNHWMWLLPIILSVVEFIILFIFRKNKIINSSDMYGEIINYVILAEKRFGAGHGDEKLQYVIDLYLNAHPNLHYGVFSDIVALVVNQILKTPQKKEK